jgi:hypothetical protein
MGLEKESNVPAVLNLLKELSSSGELSQTQLSKGTGLIVTHRFAIPFKKGSSLDSPEGPCLGLGLGLGFGCRVVVISRISLMTLRCD